MDESTALLITVEAIEFGLAANLGVLLFILHRRWPRPYVRRWAFAWWALGLHCVGTALASLATSLEPGDPKRILATALYVVPGYVGVAWFAIGVWELAKQREFPPRLLRWINLGVCLVGITIVLGTIPLSWQMRLFLRVGLRAFAMAAIYLTIAFWLLRLGSWQQGLGRRAVICLFFALGAQQAHYCVIEASWIFGQFGPPVYFKFMNLIDVVLKASMSIATVFWMVETERVRTDEAVASLRESEARLSAAFENLPFDFWVCDAEGRYVMQNSASIAHWGHRIGREDSVTESQDLVLRSWSELDQQALAGEVVQEEVAYTVGGQERHAYKVLSPFYVDGEVRGIVGVNIDVTELREVQKKRMQLEKQLLHAQKLETVGQLAGGIAHDFNNLLQVILGHTEQARTAVSGDEEGSQAIDAIAEAAGRAALLTSRMLTFSRHQLRSPATHDLNAVVDDLLKIMRRVVPENIEINFKRVDGVACVHADRGQIEQVILNLCLNARDAMPDGGSLMLQIGKITISANYAERHPWARAGDFIVLAISDTGQGMSSETRERIFEPFFTTKETGEGTGLGLAMVYGIVQQHEGFLQVQSEPGQGTRFQVFLPEVAAVIHPPSEDEPPPPKGGRETILVVEDELPVRRLACKTLAQAGYRVLDAEDGLRGVSVFRERKNDIDLVLVDAIMPRMGGREVYEHVQKLAPDVPVLFTSGYSGDALPQTFLESNGLRVLSKPYMPDTLLRNVRAVLDASPLTPAEMKPEGVEPR